MLTKTFTKDAYKDAYKTKALQNMSSTAKWDVAVCTRSMLQKFKTNFKRPDELQQLMFSC